MVAIRNPDAPHTPKPARQVPFLGPLLSAWKGLGKGATGCALCVPAAAFRRTQWLLDLERHEYIGFLQPDGGRFILVQSPPAAALDGEVSLVEIEDGPTLQFAVLANLATLGCGKDDAFIISEGFAKFVGEGM